MQYAPLLQADNSGIVYLQCCTLIIVLLVLVVVLATSIKVVREYQRIVVFRLGKVIGARGPGILSLIPIADKPVWVDLREQHQEILHQTCTTKDRATISVDLVIFFRVVDAVASVVEVANFADALQGIATKLLSAVIGDISRDDVPAQREQINQVLRTKLDEVTERWGVQVTAVEIKTQRK